MKTQKLSFNAISGVLSRSEMKKIMAGSSSGEVCSLKACSSDSDCGSGGQCTCKEQGTYKACV